MIYVKNSSNIGGHKNEGKFPDYTLLALPTP